MLNVSADTKTAYKSEGSLKEITITFPNKNITLTNSDIVAESVCLKECINSGNQLQFTGCIATSFSFECADFATDVRGEYIEAKIQIDDTDEIPLFHGYVNEVTNRNHEDVTRKITAYDVLYTINNADVTSWYNSLSFPISIRNMRYSFFAYFGITQVEDVLDNDPMPVDKTIDDEHISGATILKNICQINGRFGQINRDGQFIYRKLIIGTESLYPRLDLYPSDEIFPAEENALENINKSYYKSCTYEDYRVAEITKVQLVGKGDSILATAGSGTNAFTISGNPLIYGKTSAELQNVAQNLYNVVHGLWYVPSKVTSVGLPYVECGDFILLATRRNIVRFYCLDRTLKGIQALEDSYIGQGDKTQPVYKSNARSTSQKVAEKTKSDLATEKQQRIEADTINANLIQAETLRAKNVEAQKATIDQLNATNATVQNLSAEYANFKSATIDNLTVLNSLSVKTITTDNLSAQTIYGNQIRGLTISASQITSGKISADRISADVFSGKTVSVGSLGATYGVYAAQLGANVINNRAVRWEKIKDANGKEILVLAGANG